MLRLKNRNKGDICLKGINIFISFLPYYKDFRDKIQSIEGGNVKGVG